jgi:hypothetical protein
MYFLFFTSTGLLTSFSSSAQLKEGDIFKDYVWSMPDDFRQGFLRVIGDGDYREPNGMRKMYPEDAVKDGWVLLKHEVDLNHATKAELVIERLQSHDGTTGLAASINGHNWHFIQFPKAVPEPKANYMQHNYPVVPISLSEIKQGTGNRIRFRVDSIQRFNKPQNIIYGFRLRIYYNENKKHPSARIAGLVQGQPIRESQTLSLKNIKGAISNVQYIGWYKGVNWEGDGNPRQWHYTYYRGAMQNTIGASNKPPYTVQWNTEWIPDQENEVKISAIVSDASGLSYFLPAIGELHFERDYSVELCMPFDVPEN